ncbi:MAG TPA: hypothetical protein VK668_20225 [Mucilaginibacter sp.]|nr:hypothetical protein [Mucilaginibacter sp.]
MSDAENTPMSFIKNYNWPVILNVALLCSKGVIVLSILCLVSFLTVHYILLPYSICVIGIWCGLSLYAIVSMVKRKSVWIRKPYNKDNLKHADNSELLLLLTEITNDIHRYQAASYNNFLNVRSYKHTTLILSGVSTILLGLSLEKIFPSVKDQYSLYAKNIAFIIGAIITVYSAITSYWNIEKYWLINKSIANKLIALKFEVEDLDTKDPILPDDIQKMVVNYQNIKLDFYKYWEGALSGKGAQNEQAGK